MHFNMMLSTRPQLALITVCTRPLEAIKELENGKGGLQLVPQPAELPSVTITKQKRAPVTQGLPVAISGKWCASDSGK